MDFKQQFKVVQEETLFSSLTPVQINQILEEETSKQYDLFYYGWRLSGRQKQPNFWSLKYRRGKSSEYFQILVSPSASGSQLLVKTQVHIFLIIFFILWGGGWVVGGLIAFNEFARTESVAKGIPFLGMCFIPVVFFFIFKYVIWSNRVTFQNNILVNLLQVRLSNS